MKDENSPVLFLNLQRRKVKWKLFLRCKNDVCVGALSVNFTMLYFMWFVSHFTVDVTRLLSGVDHLIFDGGVVGFLDC